MRAIATVLFVGVLARITLGDATARLDLVDVEVTPTVARINLFIDLSVTAPSTDALVDAVQLDFNKTDPEITANDFSRMTIDTTGALLDEWETIDSLSGGIFSGFAIYDSVVPQAPTAGLGTTYLAQLVIDLDGLGLEPGDSFVVSIGPDSPLNTDVLGELDGVSLSFAAPSTPATLEFGGDGSGDFEFTVIPAPGVLTGLLACAVGFARPSCRRRQHLR